MTNSQIDRLIKQLDGIRDVLEMSKQVDEGTRLQTTRVEVAATLAKDFEREIEATIEGFNP